MKRVLVLVFLLLLLLAGCAGTPQSRETGSTAIVGVLGVEESRGGLRVTAAAEGRGEEDPEVYQGQGASPAAAIESLTNRGERVVSCAHVEHLLLGQTAAGELPTLLSYAFQEPQQSTETQLWVVRGASLAEVFSGPADPARRMSVLKAAGKDRQGFRPVTLRQAAGALAQGESLLIPALELGPEGLSFVGFALYDQGEIVTWLTGDAALGASLLLGERIHWTGSVGERGMSLQSTGCQVTPILDGERLTGLSLACRLEGVPTGGWQTRDQDRQRLELETARAIQRALVQIQAAGTDGAELLRRAGLSRPVLWQRVSSQWATAFPALPAEISVQITVAERH